MVGLLVVTHGRFSRELIKSIELIIGHQKTVEALTLEEGDDVNKLREEVEKKTEELDQGEGVLVLVDLLGGSPWNVSSICTKKEAVECVAGLNMPMLLEAIESRETCAGIKADMHESGSGRRSKCQRIVFRLFRGQRRLKEKGDRKGC